MVKLTVKNRDSFDKQLRTAINVKMARVIANSESFLVKTAEMLRDKFAESFEFADLQTKLVGEFGFTPEEVSALPRILNLLIPNNNVTKVNLKISPNKQEAILEWVDFAALRDSKEALHKLTKLNPNTGSFEVTDIISWVEWLENGQVIRGYEFDGQQAGKFSRSGQGIMRRTGGIWEYAPTRVFTKIAQGVKDADIARGLGVVIRKTRLK